MSYKTKQNECLQRCEDLNDYAYSAKLIATTGHIIEKASPKFGDLSAMFTNVARINQGAHAGQALDIADSAGDNRIFAPFEGTMTVSKDPLCGSLIELISTDKMYRVMLCHVKPANANKKKAAKGSLIGTYEVIGNSTGPHLHVSMFIHSASNGWTPVAASQLQQFLIK